MLIKDILKISMELSSHVILIYIQFFIDFTFLKTMFMVTRNNEIFNRKEIIRFLIKGNFNIKDSLKR